MTTHSAIRRAETTAAVQPALFDNSAGDRPLPPRAEMERAFLGSDRSYDGIFFTAVKSTGIFCRPSCPARKPLPRNVEFFGTVKNALFAGYRPCLRCRPLEIETSRPEWVDRLLTSVEESPTRRFSAGDLSVLGIDPARARRYFIKAFGLTFQAYCRGRRLAKALDVMRNGGTLDDATFESGYDSLSGFRDSFAKAFGHPPGQLRDAECIHVTWLDTPIGPMIAAATVEGICLLEFTDRRMLEAELGFLRRRLAKPFLPGETEHLRQLKNELHEYFAGTRRQFSVPLVREGSPFENRVWDELLKIPYGEVCTYQEIASRVGHPQAARAVGRANGCNHIAIVIPCHRVIAKNGDIAGYGGGVWRKRLLLHREQTA